MKRLALTLATVVPLAVLGAAPTVSDAAAARTRVVTANWHVYTADAVKHVVANAATFTTETCNPVTELYLKGKVKHAVKGKSFTEIWVLDGVRQGKIPATWGKSGSFTDYFAWTDTHGLATGTWRVKLVSKAGRIGGGKVVLAPPPARAAC